ncbi:hypothetical protein X742_33635 [Mesorhizobium sp. LNHC232B00]|nr:hypothetical protein X742_33635 [Mesorhizobium sp. LNHC232B00]
MQFGEIVANLCATVFLLSLAAIVFLLFGKPIWPERMGLMVIVRLSCLRMQCKPVPSRPCI